VIASITLIAVSSCRVQAPIARISGVVVMSVSFNVFAPALAAHYRDWSTRCNATRKTKTGFDRRQRRSRG
jgi:hypothetical protein